MNRLPLLRSSASLLLLGLSLLPAVAQPQRRSDNPFAPPGATLHYARNRDYDARHLKLVFDIDAVHYAAQGVVTHTLVPLRPALNAVTFDAGQNLKIARCRINGEDSKFTHTKDVLTITASNPLPRGKEATVEIEYAMPGEGAPGGPNGFGGFYWIKTDPENPDRAPGFWTQGETETNRTWVPCYDYPNNFVTSETMVTVPENWEVIGNGEQGKTTADPVRKTRTFRWTMKQPHATYLLSLAGGEVDIRRDSWEGVSLLYVVPKGRAALIEPSFGNTKDMLSFFSQRLGVKYAWPKYAQDAMLDFGGGMENVSATTLGADSLTDRRNGNFTMSSLNSHELAHQWFGDLVTCKDWGDLWLNESFATFFEMAYLEHFEGKDRYDFERSGALEAYLNESKRYKRPLSTKLYTDSGNMFDSHTYPKGGLILHMLRRELGDDDFFRGLGHYLKVNRHKPVDTHDLSKAIEEETGRNVEAFFNQWIYKPGHPVLETTWTYDEAGKAVVVRIKQKQETSAGTPIYVLPLTIGLLGISSGSAMERKVVTLESATQEFRLPAERMPETVLIDPDHDLLMENKIKQTPDELTVIARRAPCVVDRLAAVEKMKELDLKEAQKTLIESLPQEGNGQVAAAMLDVLSLTPKEELRPLFREQAKSKQAERRAAALTALGKLPRTEEDAALLRKMALSDTEPYIVVEAALRGLSKFGAAAPLEPFRHQVASLSLHDRLSVSAVEALAEGKIEAATSLLIEATSAKFRLPVRRSAAKALGSVGKSDAAATAALRSMLAEKEQPRLQEAAVNALRERKDKEAIPLLRALETSGKTPQLKEAAKKAADELAK